MNIFNTRTLSQNQRFQRIIPIGIVAAIILGFAYGFISDLAGGWELHVLYIILGFAIAYVVRVIGRGAQPRFQVLGAILAIIVIVIGDIIYPVVVHQLPIGLMFSYTLRNMLSGISGLLSLLFRLSAIYIAYSNSI